MNLQHIDDIFERNQDRYLREWQELLRFPSISGDPEHDADCLDCANWLLAKLKRMGLDARLLDTATKPVVFAETAPVPDCPTVLFYGHYDVQPVDPLEAWDSAPFEPTLRDGRLYARGAQDNKGQHFYVLCALEALLAQDTLNVNLKIVLEGEEESGSDGITAGMPGWQDLLRADILMVTDVGMAKPDTPTIIMGLRGIVHLTAELTGPGYDLHSGVHGGVAPNPAQGMASLIASLFNADGSIAVAGYYDGLEPPTEAERALLQTTLPFDEAAYEAETGVAPTGGERALYSAPERLGFRPSIDINGLASGYSGKGGKTIIPASAMAKITSRLAAGQDPEACLERLEKHLHVHTPAGLELKISERGAAGEGFRVDPASDLIKHAKAVLDQLSDRKTLYRWEGASIPVIAELSRVSGAEPLLIGFGAEEDHIHAPNESFSIKQFRQGFRYACLMLAE